MLIPNLFLVFELVFSDRRNRQKNRHKIDKNQHVPGKVGGLYDPLAPWSRDQDFFFTGCTSLEAKEYKTKKIIFNWFYWKYKQFPVFQ